MRSSASGRIGQLSAYRNKEIGTREECISQGDSAYDYHVKTYGHPSKFGFMEIDNLWKAERWEPEKLMALYKRAGAKYFFALANHHDNFDAYDSKYHAWNSVNVGPKKGHRRNLGQSRTREWSALWRQQSLGSLVALVPGGIRVRC